MHKNARLVGSFCLSPMFLDYEPRLQASSVLSQKCNMYVNKEFRQFFFNAWVRLGALGLWSCCQQFHSYLFFITILLAYGSALKNNIKMLLVALVSSWLFLLQNNNNKGHAKFSHAKSPFEHFPLFCGVLIREIFSFTLLFSPFLQWILFCFHLPCSGNKADFYLYAQMLGRCNLVGFLYSSPCSLFLSLSLLPLLSFLYVFEHL